MTFLQHKDHAQIYIEHTEPLKPTEMTQIDTYLQSLSQASMVIEKSGNGTQITIYDKGEK